MTTAIVFDIDGTLAYSSKVHLDALAKVASKAFKIPASFNLTLETPYLNNEPIAGYTDAQCFYLLANQAGMHLTEERLIKLTEEYVALYKKELSLGAYPGKLITGVEGTLKTLQENKVLLGLYTGNAAGIAENKLKALGIAEYFTFKDTLGFGGLHKDRTIVAKAAIEATRADVTYLVGDTVSDIKTAKVCGVYSIGVTTGSASGKQLLAAGATAVLKSVTGIPGYLGLVTGRLPLVTLGTLGGADSILSA